MTEIRDLVLPLAEKIIELATDKNVTISTAESCTGGYIGQYLTSIAGASNAYHGGLIAYDNAVKINQLNIDPEMLADKGAVSPEVARAMAEGVRFMLNTTAAVSVTGIAGPGGGTLTKPVGLVYIGLAQADGETVVREFRFGHHPREEIRLMAVHEALKMLSIFLA